MPAHPPRPYTVAECVADQFPDGLTWRNSDGVSLDDVAQRLTFEIAHARFAPLPDDCSVDPNRAWGEWCGNTARCVWCADAANEPREALVPCFAHETYATRWVFADGSAIVRFGDGWAIEGSTPFSWIGA